MVCEASNLATCPCLRQRVHGSSGRRKNTLHKLQCSSRASTDTQCWDNRPSAGTPPTAHIEAPGATTTAVAVQRGALCVKAWLPGRVQSRICESRPRSPRGAGPSISFTAGVGCHATCNTRGPCTFCLFSRAEVLISHLFDNPTGIDIEGSTGTYASLAGVFTASPGSVRDSHRYLVPGEYRAPNQDAQAPQHNSLTDIASEDLGKLVRVQSSQCGNADVDVS